MLIVINMQHRHARIMCNACVSVQHFCRLPAQLSVFTCERGTLDLNKLWKGCFLGSQFSSSCNDLIGVKAGGHFHTSADSVMSVSALFSTLESVISSARVWTRFAHSQTSLPGRCDPKRVRPLRQEVHLLADGAKRVCQPAHNHVTRL